MIVKKSPMSGCLAGILSLLDLTCKKQRKRVSMAISYTEKKAEAIK